MRNSSTHVLNIITQNAILNYYNYARSGVWTLIRLIPTKYHYSLFNSRKKVLLLINSFMNTITMTVSDIHLTSLFVWYPRS